MNDINLVKGEKKSKFKLECFGNFWIRIRFETHADPSVAENPDLGHGTVTCSCSNRKQCYTSH